MFRRLLLVALLLEAGLLLLLIPWSAFWDRNYFAESVPWLQAVLTTGFVRGAVSGLGLLNIAAAIGELVELFGRRPDHGLTEEPSRLGDHHAP